MHKESIRTIISEKFISVLLCTGGGYTCCIIPRYDAYLFSQAIKEAISSQSSISFETSLMSVDILNMADVFIIDFTNKFTASGFQISCKSGKEMGEALESAALKGVEEFGKPQEKNCKWAYIRVLQDPA